MRGKTLYTIPPPPISLGKSFPIREFPQQILRWYLLFIESGYKHITWLATPAKDRHLLPIITMMNKTQICEMLSVMSDMTKAACEGVNFVEVSTYVRNHCPGIEPEFVEVFRDMIYPIVRKNR